MWRLVGAALLALLTVAASAEQDCASDSDAASLLSLKLSRPSVNLAESLQKQRPATRPRDISALIGKSVYFVLVDRFGRVDGNDQACGNSEDNNFWCNGTLRGITNHLDYIKGMGFDCVWITPVVKQSQETTLSGTGCMGYWAENLYEIEPHFGTPEDMHDLVKGLHDRDMSLMLDFVANHMGPLHSTADVRRKFPFNETRHYHTLNISGMTFDEYVSKTSDWPPPVQAMWSQSGAQCTQGQSCNCYKCVEEQNLLGLPNSYGPCRGRMVFDPKSPCPKGSLSPYCMPGDLGCKGYNETITQQGWFYDLGDLNQEDPFVRSELLKWISWMVRTYKVDVLRLDTAPFMPFDFLSELQEAAGVPIIGEVTATNMTYHAQFQADPPTPTGQPVLDGVLNFPLHFAAVAGFCHTWMPFATGNLTFLEERMEEQLRAPYRNVDALGNFVDNHDGDRITKACGADASRVINAITWTMLARGVPIVYYGTELLLTWSRESFWQYGFNTKAPLYKLLRSLNALRKERNLALADLEVVPTSDRRTLVFTRGGRENVWAFLNNLPRSEEAVWYCKVSPPSKDGFAWVNVLTGRPARFTKGFDGSDCLVSEDTMPQVLVRRPVKETLDFVAEAYAKFAEA